MVKTSRYIRLVMGSFFGTWNWYDFWRRSWGLPCSRPLLRTRCWFVVWRWCVSCSWRRYLGGKLDIQGTGFNLLRVQFWTSVQRKRVLKRGQKVDPLEIKSGPPWRVQFWPLHCDKSIKTFISSWSWFHQQQLRLEFWTGEAHFCAPATFWWLKKVAYIWTIALLVEPPRPVASCQSDNHMDSPSQWVSKMGRLFFADEYVRHAVETYTNKQLPQQHIALKAVQDVLADLEMNSSHCWHKLPFQNLCRTFW